MKPVVGQRQQSPPANVSSDLMLDLRRWYVSQKSLPFGVGMIGSISASFNGL